MYTLRRILQDGIEYNFLLGKSYTLILKERVSEREWAEVSESYWGETTEQEKHITECYGFIRAEDGSMHFLLPWQSNYVMTESGRTFSKL